MKEDIYYATLGILVIMTELRVLVFFVTFPHGVLGQVGYLIVSIPDLCLLPYFELSNSEYPCQLGLLYSSTCTIPQVVYVSDVW